MNRYGRIAEWAAWLMFLGVQPGFTLRSDLRSGGQKDIVGRFRVDDAHRSHMVAVEVPLQGSPSGDSGLEDFVVYGINETEWKIPSPHRKENVGMKVDTVLVSSDLSQTNFKENRAEWKVDSDGASVQSFKVEEPQNVASSRTEAQHTMPLVHRWKITEMSPRTLHVIFAVVLVISLGAAFAVYVYRAAGGTWGMRSSDKLDSKLPKGHIIPAGKDTEVAVQKIQARLDRFDERIWRTCNKDKVPEPWH